MAFFLGNLLGLVGEGQRRGRPRNAENGGVPLDKSHEVPFAHEADVLLEVAEEEGMGLVGLDDGLELEDHGGLLAELHHPVEFGDPVVGLLLGPSSTAGFLPSRHPYGEARDVAAGAWEWDMAKHQRRCPRTEKGFGDWYC